MFGQFDEQPAIFTYPEAVELFLTSLCVRALKTQPQ